MTIVKDLGPKGSCPKCGVGYFESPRYESRWQTGVSTEWLEWACDNCGFVIRTKTADAK